MNSGNLRADLPQALIVVWLIVSVLFAGAAASPFIVSAEDVSRLVPACESRLRGEKCSLCGVTAAYFDIASGDLAAAGASNRAAIPLWLGSWANFACALTYVVCKGDRCKALL